jgi:arylsulfatase A-like enzyme
MMKLKKTVAAICATSAVVYGAMTPLQEAIAKEVKRPNFVTIVIDDMGYSDLGVFGGEASTPNLDELATDGMILTNFYAGATSSPSRAMLLSGKDNHNAGLGNMREVMERQPRVEQEGQPGYEGVLSLDVLPFPQILQDNAYHTMITGKWHMGGDQINEEAYYAFNRGFTETRGLLLAGGDLDFMISAEGKYLTEHSVEHMHGRASLYNDNGVETDFTDLPPLTHSTDYYTDNAIEMLEKMREDGISKPFYLNMSYLAPHMPLQAPKELIDKYVNTYAVGWEKIREQRLNNLKQLGYIPQHVELSERPGDVSPWEDLSDREKQLEARRMAIYAAELDLLDQNVGRLVQYLKNEGAYENTVFFVYSDNGPANMGFASPPEGVTYHDEMAKKVNELSDADFQQMMTDLGGPTSWISPNSGWGSVSGTPFRNYKGDSFDGGNRGAAFVHYPQTKATGVKTNCLYSVMDIAPTMLEMAEIQYPTKYKGKTNEPMDGVSMAGVFEGNLVCNPERWIGFELLGIKGLRKGNWKLAQGNNMGNKVGLYNVWDDPFEQHNLSAEKPALYQEMLGLYQQYAEENGVIEINNLYLPDLDIADPNMTTAKIRGGSTSVGIAGTTGFFQAEASFKPTTLVSVAGEIRPESEHLGLPARIFAYAMYTAQGDTDPVYYWTTEYGTVYKEIETPMIPFKNVSELPPMVLIPIYDGPLPEEATIEVILGYELDDGTLIDNVANPMTITVTE